MKMVLFSVHDTLATTWSFPTVAANAEVAKRDFSRIQQQPGFPVKDCECVLIGEYDSEKGVVAPVDHQVLVPVPSK